MAAVSSGHERQREGQAGHVVVAGVEVTYPVGHYEIRSYVRSKLVWTRVTGGATEALAALKLAQKRANAVALADDAGVLVVEGSVRTGLRDSYRRFVQAAINRGSMESAEIYKRTLEEFLDGCSKTYADELTNEDVTKFQMQMKKRGLSPRTIHNRHMSLRAFLLTLGYGIKEMKEIAGKAPRFDKTLPEIYEPVALKSFFDALDRDYDKLLFSMLLTTGLREREAMHLEFVDISHARRVLQVRSKPAYGHRIKDAEEREMPLTAKLVKQLLAYKERHPDARLVFGKRGGIEDAPDGHLLRRLKVLVRNAGLNCGTCSTCISSKECEHWFLHKFRATCITMLLRNGLDLRSVMALSGHADLESGRRFLRPAGTA